MSKEPIVVKAYGDNNDWVIYMRPSYRDVQRQMETTMGEVFDRIERAKIRGGVPVPMIRLPARFPSQGAAIQSIGSIKP